MGSWRVAVSSSGLQLVWVMEGRQLRQRYVPLVGAGDVEERFALEVIITRRGHGCGYGDICDSGHPPIYTSSFGCVLAVQGKLKQVQSDFDSCRAQLTSSQFGEKALKARIKEVEGQLARAQQQQQQQQQPAKEAMKEAPPPPPREAPPAVDMSMLSMMEGQLGRLSEIIRSREAELLQMRAALQVRTGG